MRSLRLSRFAAVALFATTLSGTAASAAIGASTPAGAASLPACNLKTLANHKGLVQITFWESASEANLTTLQGITSAFNSSQTKVHVTLVTQTGYDGRSISPASPTGSCPTWCSSRTSARRRPSIPAPSSRCSPA